ncbi:hypothetical protein [Desulfovibrio litoralis]|uniref:Uncharacterized protein n=1 Tax=Desulfovibrio litoralis DSM 11393 TaxID=1121455 RepID=A0A1M7RYN2_9BACT|nr:hypothetical protein [Desulfovibrio litoralis]SHN51276.1 hypothetical protein SAMN02745728_00334 [Desulfovibrio litoralis DSM 11393]
MKNIYLMVLLCFFSFGLVACQSEEEKRAEAEKVQNARGNEAANALFNQASKNADEAARNSISR